MTYQDFRRLCLSAADCKDFDQFAAESGGSVDCEDADALLRQLRYIWDYAKAPAVATIRALSGLSRAKFSSTYRISIRTLEDWESGRRPNKSQYIVDLLAYAVMGDAVCE